MSEKAFKPEPSKDSSDRIKRTDPDKESRGLPFLFNREQTEALSKTMSVGFDEGPTVKPSGNVQAKAGPGQQPVARQMPDLSKLKPTVPPKSPAQLKKEEQFRETWGMQHMSPEKQMQLKLKYDKEGLEADMARGHFNNYVKQQAKQLKRNKHEKNLLNNKANAFKRAMIQNKIAYGSPEYNTAVKQCFPDFDTELPAYKKDVGKNPVNDDPKLEHEADVMGKQAAEGKTVQKQEEEKERQAKKGGSNPPSPSGSGTKTKLPEEVQSKMENSFGTSFSDVNIHPNDEGAKDMGALAYTQGKDVHFAPGQYSPGTQKGQELIGHELTHVEQQKAGKVQPTAQGKGMAVNDDPKLENEADEMGKKASEGKAAAPQVADTTQNIRRKEINDEEKINEPSNEKSKKEGAGVRIILFNPKKDYVKAYTIVGDNLKEAFELDNGSIVETQPDATPYVNLTAIKGVNKKTEEVFYVPSVYAGVYLDKLVAQSNRVKKYGMIWREELTSEERRIYLEQKKYSDVEIEKILGDKNSIETFFALYRNKPGNAKSAVRKVLDYNTRVFVISVPFPGWSYVETEDGERGYVKSAAVNTRMPSNNSKLYQIQEADNLEKIIDGQYGTVSDRRLFANAIMHVNNPDNSPGKGVVYKGTFSPRELIKVTSYDKFHVNKKQWIWIPDESFVYSIAEQLPDYSVKEKVKEYARDISGFVAGYVDQIWPQGYGMQTEGNVGITFGVPVGVDIQAITSFYRKDADNFVVRRYIRGGVGLDTGLGYGLYIGSSKGIGAGAEAGVNASAMGTGYSDIEFTFPFKKDTVLITMLASLMEGPKVDDAGTVVKKTPKKAFYEFLHSATAIDLDTSKYITKSKAAIGLVAQGSGEAQGGFFTDKKKRKKYKAKYDRHKEQDAPSAIKVPLLNRLKIKAGAFLKQEAFLGVDLEDIERDEETRQVKKAKGSIFVDLSAQGNLSIPLLPAIALEGGGEAKLIFNYENGDWEQVGAQLVYKSGELESYQGPGMEIAAGFSNEEIKDLTNKNKLELGDILSVLSKIKFKKRFELLPSINIGRKFHNAIRKQDRAKVLLKENYGHAGGSLENYLTIDVDFSKFMNKEGAKDLITAAKEVIENIKNSLDLDTKSPEPLIKEFIQHIMDVITKGKPIIDTSVFFPIWEFLTKYDAIVNAELALVGKIGAAAGANVAAAEGKIRIEGSMEAGSFKKENVMNIINRLLSKDKVNFLLDLFNPEQGETVEKQTN